MVIAAVRSPVTNRYAAIGEHLAVEVKKPQTLDVDEGRSPIAAKGPQHVGRNEKLAVPGSLEQEVRQLVSHDVAQLDLGQRANTGPARITWISPGQQATAAFMRSPACAW